MIRYPIFVLLCFFCLSCKSQNCSYESLLELEATHEIVNEELLNSLNEIVFDKNYFGDFEKPVIAINIEELLGNYKICVTLTDFIIFKKYRPELFEKLVGNLKYKNTPMLLFGHVDSSFLKDLGNAFNDIVGELPIYDKDNPPIFYNPKIICFEK